MNKILFGLDHLLLQQNRFQQARLGLVTNNVAITNYKEPGRAALLKKGFHITTLFSPEHGLTSRGADGIYEANNTDALTQLPVISLYGEHFMPAAEDLADIDILLLDIPDVGCRFYTYLWTMTYIMEACAIYDKPLFILDRPNPISGNMNKAEGPMLDETNCSSFIGRWNIPIRHSFTLGELAGYFSATRKMDIDLTVIPITGWNRDRSAFQNDFPFVPTSPAISSVTSAFCYPGTGLLEGINVNEGRGTGKAFTVFGAPWIDASSLLKKLNGVNLPGVGFTEIQYCPSGGIYAGEDCFGLSMSVREEISFLPVRTGIEIIQQLFSLFPEYCTERLYKTVANPSGEKHLDKLLGVENSIQKMKRGDTFVTGINNDWTEETGAFLLYP
jgi:uncharacterized protein YbbC (DUF1343 family)